MSTLLRIECPLWSGLGVHFAPEYAIGVQIVGITKIAILVVSISMVIILLIRRKRNKMAEELNYLAVFMATTLGSIINMIPAYCFPELYYPNTFLIINIGVIVIAGYFIFRGMRLSYLRRRNKIS